MACVRFCFGATLNLNELNACTVSSQPEKAICSMAIDWHQLWKEFNCPKPVVVNLVEWKRSRTSSSKLDAFERLEWIERNENLSQSTASLRVLARSVKGTPIGVCIEKVITNCVRGSERVRKIRKTKIIGLGNGPQHKQIAPKTFATHKQWMNPTRFLSSSATAVTLKTLFAHRNFGGTFGQQQH